MHVPGVGTLEQLDDRSRARRVDHDDEPAIDDRESHSHEPFAERARRQRLNRHRSLQIDWSDRRAGTNSSPHSTHERGAGTTGT